MLTVEEIDEGLPDISWVPKCRRTIGGMLVDQGSEPGLIFRTGRLSDCPLLGREVQTPLGVATINNVFSHPGGYWLLHLKFEEPVTWFRCTGTAPDYDGIRLSRRGSKQEVHTVSEKELRWMVSNDDIPIFD